MAVALTSGSRPASAGPNTIPYASVTTPPNSRLINDAGQKPIPAWLISCQSSRAPIAPTAPNARFRTPVERYRTTMPTPDNAYTPPSDSPVIRNCSRSVVLGMGPGGPARSLLSSLL